MAVELLVLTAAAFKAALPPVGCVIGIDYGSHRIGLALSDLGRTIATPWQVLPRESWAKTSAALLAAIKGSGAVGLVLGMPVALDGSVMPMTQATRQFCRNLAKLCPLPIVLAEERFSSATAEKALLEADVRRKERGDLRDKVAAALLLQQFLENMQP